MPPLRQRPRVSAGLGTQQRSELGPRAALPHCETQRSVVLDREGVEAFNREIYLGSQALAREADSMTRRNFAEESAKLVEALARDLILPMDF